jgi:hypothetical protein
VTTAPSSSRRRDRPIVEEVAPQIEVVHGTVEDGAAALVAS